MQDSDLVNRNNAEYLDRLFEQYQQNPTSVDPSWQAFFAGMDKGKTESPPPSFSHNHDGARSDIGIFDLVHSYRELGHFVANLDPLGHERPHHPLLELSQFNVKQWDMDLAVSGGGFNGWTGGTLRDLIEILKQTYTRTIGVEFTGISDKHQRDWLTQRMEPILNRPRYTAAQSQAIMFQLIAAEEFEKFLHTRYVGQKRFSLEGAEALVPMINTLIDEGGNLGAEQLIMSMAHRGRLNILAHVCNKPYESILSEFEGTSLKQDSEGDGDVKYHLGYANTRATPSGKQIKMSLAPNPSHLELIDPVVQGIVRCRQTVLGDKDRTKAVPIVMHGDAAFTGQGIVHETLNLSELAGWRTGGTIHVIVNNQIGFTTPPKQGRFTPYPTDVAKMIQAPIFHVNGDDPEACVWAAKLAIGFRQQFKCDVFIDMWCYRRHGHNETDEPSFTQPVLYRQIENHPSVRKTYEERLLDHKKVTQQQLDDMKNLVISRMESARTNAKVAKPREKAPRFAGVWKGFGRAGADWSAHTALPREALLKIVESTATMPEGFNVHPKLKKILATRLESVQNGKGIDWGNAEMLALGSMLLEGTPIRFTGQDVERGTFSHRHAVLHDYTNGRIYTPLAHLAENQPEFCIMNTMLSELAVLGFEWGYSSGDPRNLCIWEAQFGDFVNGAQSIIDQIIAPAESKWRYMNGLVILLPHGYEGQGPEHSNAYLDRFLALCADNNMQVAVPSTPAQYFHLLRRQIHRKFRKPLIVMMPKGLLRFEPSASKIEDFTDSEMQLVMDDPLAAPRDQIRRVLFCSGKVYYSLLASREKDKEKLGEIAIVRVEQLYPFPKKEIQTVLAKYRHAQEIAWVQEEPKNRGGWAFVEPRLRELLPDNMVMSYFGREESASPATGSFKQHQIEEQELIGHALEVPPPRVPAVAPAATTPTSVSQ